MSTGRGVGAGLMAIGAGVVVVATVLATSAVLAFDRQAHDLDPSEARAEGTFAQLVTAGGVAAVGAALFVVALVVFGAATSRARRRGALRRQPTGAVAWCATVVLVGALVYALAWPQGPLALATSLAAGGGGPAGATQIVVHNGTLTGSSLSPAPPEDVYTVHPVAHSGSMRLKIGSGGKGIPGATAVATLEAADGSGWRHVTDARGPDGTVDVPSATYPGDLRIRVHLADAEVGQVEYLVALSFTPER